MKISFITSPDAVEAANCLIRIAIDHLTANPDLAAKEGVRNIDIYHTRMFKKKLVSAFLRTAKQKRKS